MPTVAGLPSIPGLPSSGPPAAPVPSTSPPGAPSGQVPGTPSGYASGGAGPAASASWWSQQSTPVKVGVAGVGIVGLLVALGAFKKGSKLNRLFKKNTGRHHVRSTKKWKPRFSAAEIKRMREHGRTVKRRRRREAMEVLFARPYGRNPKA